MAFIRKIKKGDAIYLAKVESYREDGKVKQRVLEYIGKEENGLAVEKVDVNKLQANSVLHFGDVSVLYQLCIQLKLNYLFGKHHKLIITLLIAHIICKGSIIKIFDWVKKSAILDIVGLQKLTVDNLYDTLDYLDELDFNFIEQSLYENWKNIAPKDCHSYVLDVTDTYYNGKNDKSSLRKGKDGKVSKLVQIGMAVSFDNGFPIMHKRYSGNISNIKILEDLLGKMAQRGIKSIVLDRGFFSEQNITDLNNLNIEMIVGVKQSIGIKNNVLSKIKKDEIYTSKNLIKLKGTVVYAIEQAYLFGKLIIIYNPKYEAMKKDKMLLDGSSDDEVKYVGFSILFHNTKILISDIVVKYFEKDIVERSFRTMKSDVQLHPIRNWLPQRVEAHVKICYLAMCLLSYMKFKCSKLEMSSNEILSNLETIYKIKLEHTITKKSFTKVVTQSNAQINILKKLKCSV